MTPEAEAEAIQALDRANSLRLVGGSGLALLGAFLLFYLLVRSKTKPIPLLPFLLSIMLILGGLYLAGWQVAY